VGCLGRRPRKKTPSVGTDVKTLHAKIGQLTLVAMVCLPRAVVSYKTASTRPKRCASPASMYQLDGARSNTSLSVTLDPFTRF
jgi:hypothetical protein